MPPLAFRRHAVAALVLLNLAACAGDNASSTRAPSENASAIAEVTSIDRDLLDVTVARLADLYAKRSYTARQVTEWHLARIDRYNGVYGAIETVLRDQALARADSLDAAVARGDTVRGPLWGVPVVIKANTSVAGQITTAGWSGFTTPGLELVAPRDATVVEKFKAAGAIIVGLANMPDLANSDTNRSSSFGRTGNAYDVRFSPGGSSGGVVTAVAANMAVLGNGTDTGNSIRMPAATSSLVGIFPTRGLVSIAGIAPLDWLLDNTGPIARTIDDAAIALQVMTGADSLDARTLAAPDSARRLPAVSSLATATLKGKRVGVPAFIMAGRGVPFHGIPYGVPEAKADSMRRAADMPLRPETRAAFDKALDALRAAGAEIVSDDGTLGDDFARLASRVATYAYMKDGTDQFLARFGPAAYHTSAEYQIKAKQPLYTSSIGTEPWFSELPGVRITQRSLAADTDAERMYHAPRQAVLDAYVATLDRLKLDGFVYPAIQMPPPDESMPQDGALSTGPHSATSWVNMIGVPAIVVPAGQYANGLPFGLEFSARPWRDGELLGVAAAFARTGNWRMPPVLVERGLLPTTPARRGR